MLVIDDNQNIFLTRGDNASLTVVITDDEGQTYELQSADKLLFTVKINCNTDDIVMQKDISSSSVISIVHNDTKDLVYGSYWYDVQLTTAGGDVKTVIPPKNFNITKEVTFNV